MSVGALEPVAARLVSGVGGLVLRQGMAWLKSMRLIGGILFWLLLAGGGLVGPGLYSSAGPAAGGAIGPGGLALVMVEEAGCGFCRRWHTEVGPGYPLSDEGRRAPLVTIDIASSEASRYSRVVFTPTFILTRDGNEVGRITGYPGADFFWSLLSEMLGKLDAAGVSDQASRR